MIEKFLQRVKFFYQKEKKWYRMNENGPYSKKRKGYGFVYGKKNRLNKFNSR